MDIQWGSVAVFSLGISLSAELSLASQPLTVVYPPANHETIADSIFIIGSAPALGEVIINDKVIKRSSKGNFSPTIPLNLGENKITIRYGKEEITRIITKKNNQPSPDKINSLATDFITPNQNISRLTNEIICFSTITPNSASTYVTIANQTIPLKAEIKPTNLPPNSSILIAQNQPQQNQNQSWQKVSGCTSFAQTQSNLQPIFTMNYQGKTIVNKTDSNINILDPESLIVIEVTSEQGIARTGASTNHSRLTPLPKGTRAMVTGREGEWLRLDYGGWILESETKVLPTNTPPTAIIRSVTSRQISRKNTGVKDTTEVIFPLTNPVPISITQTDDRLTLSLYNTTAQTDTIRFDDNPLIKRLDWYQVSPTRIDYTFHFKSKQQWGYDLRYEGNSLILTFNHQPPQIKGNNLNGIVILLDPGHGGNEFGSVGGTGYAEKDVNLVVSKLLAKELGKRGAKVFLTRENDTFVSLSDRQKMINEIKPTIAFSIHYNALPDGGNAEETKGISTFWYNSQSHNLAVFMHNYLTEKLNRTSYGIFWNNLALTRPHTTPLVLLELGFMTHPEELEWISEQKSQQQLAMTIANGVTEWLKIMNNE